MLSYTKKILICCTFLTALSVVHTTVSMVTPQELHLNPLFAKYFEKISNYNNGEAIGWLKVPQGPGKSRVLVILKGKTFYNPKIRPKDYTIEYYGTDTNGARHIMPKGLFYWDTEENNLKSKGSSVYGKVRPGVGSPYINKEFDWDHATGKWKSKDGMLWDETKVNYESPSKETTWLINQLQ